MLPKVFLARHGETQWSITGQHTGMTDLPLTEQGERNARMLGNRLELETFSDVYTSPLKRAFHTCGLAGFGDVAKVKADLVEWNYGDYEGITTKEIRAKNPTWDLYRDGCPNGESPADVLARARRVVDLARDATGNVLLFSSGHFLRIVAVQWLKIDIANARCLFLGTAALSVLGYDHAMDDPVIRLWNEMPGGAT